MRKWFVWAALGSIALGLGWRYLYLWLPCRVVGLFAPVNGSVWEQMKPLFWPPAAAAAILAARFGHGRIVAAFSACLLAIPAALLALYYPLCAGFGLDGATLLATLGPVLTAGGFALAYRRALAGRGRRMGGVWLMLLGVYGAALVLFSVAAPPLPVFTP